MKKKIVALLLALVMLVGIIPAAVFAAEGDPKVVLTVTPDKETAKAGEEVTFTVSMATEETLASMAFTTVFPEGLEYVNESGAIDGDAKKAFNFDDVAWTEWSERSEVQGDNYINGYGSKSQAGDATICTFKAVLADDAQPGEYAVELAGLDEFSDLEWNGFDESDIEVVSNPVKVEAEPKVILTITPEKDTAVAGEEVAFTISMATEETLASMAFTTAFPEGLEYVDESGAIDGDAKNAFNFDDVAWTEWTERSDVKGDNYINGYGSKSQAGDAAICTFKVVVAEDAAPGEYAVELGGLDEFSDLEWNAISEEEVKVISNPLTVVDHVCSADKLTEVAAKAATCTEDGNVAYVVCECGTKYTDATMAEVIADVIVPATGHTEAEAVIENKVEVGCENDGSYDTVVYCATCGEELSRETTTEQAYGHDETEAVIENEVAAECEKEGSYDEVVYCGDCGEELSRNTVTVDALGHTEGEAVEENREESTCVAEGSYDVVVYCSVCGEELSREEVIIPAGDGHKEAEAVIENEVIGDCVTEGSYDEVVYCEICGEELSREEVTVPVTGHDYEAVVTAPTCEDAGYTTYTCSVCGDAYVADEVEALGHTEGEAVIENEVAADCENDGSYDTVVYCSVCGDELSRETTIVPASGHDYEAVVTDPTCEEDGYTTYTCANCGDEYTDDVVAALGHDYEAVVTAPECKAQGYTTYTCANCGDNYVSDYVDELGHKHESVTTEPTCTEEGYTVCTCSVCGDTHTTDVKPALGHTEGEAVEENRVEATCTAAGSYDEVVYCSECDAELSRETKEIPVAAHTYEAVVTAPTCTDGGYTTYTCSVCGDSYVADETEALGHTAGDWEASADKPGYLAKYCTVCGALIEEKQATATGIELDKDFVSTKYIRKAVAFTLTETVLPEGAVGYDVIWTSSNEKVATVDEDGNVTTHHFGDAVITATLVDAEGNVIASDTCGVEVYYTFCQWLIWLFLLGCAWYFV